MQALRAATSQDQLTSAESQEQNALYEAMLVTTLAMLTALAPIQPPSRSRTAHQSPAQSHEAPLSAAATSVKHPGQEAGEHRSNVALQSDVPQFSGQSEDPHVKASSMQPAGPLATDEKASRPTAKQAACPEVAPTIIQQQALQSLSLSQQARQASADYFELPPSTAANASLVQPPADSRNGCLSSASSSTEAIPSQSANRHPERAFSPTSTPAHAQQPSAASQAEPIGLAVHQFLQHQTADLPSQIAELAKCYPLQSPYKGYRVDLVALLANLSYRHKAVQEKVQQLGGVELILSQCQVS